MANPNLKQGPGRPKGSKNKLPTNLVNQVLAILDDLETKKMGLTQQASKDPRWFLEHFIKPILPKNVNVEGEIKVSIRDMVDEIEKRRKIGIDRPHSPLA